LAFYCEMNRCLFIMNMQFWQQKRVPRLICLKTHSGEKVIEEIRRGAKLVFRVTRVRSPRVPFLIPKPNIRFSSASFLVYGFAIFILLGAFFLTLPISSKSGNFTSFLDALFTATSAVCTTGLVIVDTGTYWSTFGQVVLLILFQIGGFGYILGTTLVLLVMSGRFGLRERLVEFW